MLRPKALAFLLAAASSCDVLLAQPEASAPRAYTEALKRIRVADYEAALAALKDIVEREPTFSRAYGKIVDVYRRLERPAEAQRYFEDLIAGGPKNPYYHYGLAVFSSRRGQLQEAERNLKICIAGDPGFAPAYAQLLDLSPEEGHLRKVRENLVDTVQASPSNAAAVYGLGYAFYRLSEWDRALAQFDRAIALAPDLWEPHVGKVMTYRQADRLEEALPLLHELLGKVQREGDLERTGRILGLIGDLQLGLASYEQAIAYMKDTLEITRQIDDPDADQAYLARLGMAYGYVGMQAQAIDMFEKALDLARKFGQRLNEARILGLMGDAQVQLANYAEALHAFSTAASIAHDMKDRQGEASQLGSASSVYVALSDYPKALEHLDRAVGLARAVGDRYQERGFLQLRGIVQAKLGDDARALETYAQSLKIAEEIEEKRGEAETLSSIGMLHAGRGDLAQALRHHERALAIAREIGAFSVEGNALVELGMLHIALKNYPKAAEAHEKALAIGEKILNPQLIWNARVGLAMTYEAQKLDVKAASYYRQAIETIEGVRGRIQLAEEKAGFLQDKVAVYNRLVGLLVALDERDPGKGYGREAFEYTERARARAFLDLMAEAKMSVGEGMEPALLDRQRELTVRLSTIQAQILQEHSAKSPRSERIKTLEAELALADDDYLDLSREIRRRNPKYADLQYPQTVTLEQTQKLLADTEVFLLYSLGDESSFLFAVSRDDHRIARLPGVKELRERVTRLREAISSPSRASFSGFLLEAGALYQMLVQPARDLVAGKRELIVSADGILHYLPFEVLLLRSGGDMSPGRLPYLVRDYAVRYVPSAGLLAVLQEGGSAHLGAARKSFLGFGDPVYSDAMPHDASPLDVAVRSAFGRDRPWALRKLDHSREEIRRIAQLFPPGEVALFLGKEATEENAKAGGRLSEHRLVHFATHGLLNEQKPQFSGLVLSVPQSGKSGEDGLLQVYEIFNMKLNADLVVLSACETGLGKEVRGEGLVGLTRAFMYAGSPRVVVSLWKVADNSTTELMARFYGHLHDNNVGPGEALRRAQLDLIGSGTFAHPYFWAPFVLVGKP